jgi:ATP-binding protein involved in chromosome partitioning
MYQKLNVAPLGLVENMSHFVCSGCGQESDIFGKGGGEVLAQDMSVPFLGRIPIYEPIRVGGDTGVPITISEPQSPAALAFRSAAERLAAQLSIASYAKRPITLTPVS